MVPERSRGSRSRASGTQRVSGGCERAETSSRPWRDDGGEGPGLCGVPGPSFSSAERAKSGRFTFPSAGTVESHRGQEAHGEATRGTSPRSRRNAEGLRPEAFRVLRGVEVVGLVLASEGDALRGQLPPLLYRAGGPRSPPPRASVKTRRENWGYCLTKGVGLSYFTPSQL